MALQPDLSQVGNYKILKSIHFCLFFLESSFRHLKKENRLSLRSRLGDIKRSLEVFRFTMPVLGNHFWNLKLKELQSIPLQLNIEITSICNAKCIMCPRHDMERKMEVMSFETYKNIIAQAKKLGIQKFALNGYGEIFTARQDYGNFIIHLRKEIPNAYILINTNGSLMDAKAAQLLIDQKVNTVHIDIDGATKETFEKIRENLRFEMVVGNVKKLVETRRQQKAALPIVRVGILSQPANRHEVEDHQNQWRGVADFVGTDIIVSRGGSVDVKDGMRDVGHPCYLLWSEMNIWSDGGVVLCCDDWNAEENMGNVRTHSLVEIWNSAKFQKYRGLHTDGRANEIKMCKNCTWARRGPKWFETKMKKKKAPAAELSESKISYAGS